MVFGVFFRLCIVCFYVMFVVCSWYVFFSVYASYVLFVVCVFSVYRIFICGWLWVCVVGACWFSDVMCSFVFSRVCLSCFVVCGGVGGFVSVVRVCRLEGSCVFLCRCLVVMGLLGVVWLLVCWLVVFGVVWVYVFGGLEAYWFC